MQISWVSGGLPSGYSRARRVSRDLRVSRLYNKLGLSWVSGGLPSGYSFLVSNLSYSEWRRGAFRVTFAFRVRRVLGGLLSSCSLPGSNCPVLGPNSSGGTFLLSFSLWRLLLLHTSTTSKSCHMPLQSVMCSNSSAWSS